MKITILTDNLQSWFIPYGKMLEENLSTNYEVKYVFNKNEIVKGDICFLLSCSSLLQKKYLSLNKYNIVVHASSLPSGKGFSPLYWQVLGGENKITLTLFEAAEAVDAGPYYFKDDILFEGHELLSEMHEIMGNKIVNMCIKYISNIDGFSPLQQNGTETFYRRLSKEDDRINVNLSIAEQFNHFRIADNDNHPLYFEKHGHTYLLKIYKKSID